MIISRQLDNGIRVVMEKLPSVQSVSVGIWVRAGSVDETADNAGISHLIEHMLFKGTDTRSAKKIAEDVDRIGAQINAFTGKECTCYYIKTLTSNVKKACGILIDMFMNSRFDPEELEREKSVIYEEIKMIEDTPEDDAHDILSEMVFRGTSFESPIIGTFESLKGISRDHIKEYIRSEYSADSIVVSIAGNFDEEDMLSLFNGKLGTMSAVKAKKSKVSSVYVPEYRVKVKEVEQSHICIGVKGIPQEDKNYYPMVLLNSITGGSMSSRLFQNIREEKGLAYSVYSINQSYADDGIISIYAGVSHDKVEEALSAITYELKQLGDSGITQDELETAKEQLKSSYVFSQENVNSRMFSIGKNTLLFSRVLTPLEIIKIIDEVSMADIEKASRLITDTNLYSAVLVGNRQRNLEKYLKG